MNDKMLCRCLRLYGPFPTDKVLKNKINTSCARCKELANILKKTRCFRSVQLISTKEESQTSHHDTMEITTTTTTKTYNFADVLDHFLSTKHREVFIPIIIGVIVALLYFFIVIIFWGPKSFLHGEHGIFYLHLFAVIFIVVGFLRHHKLKSMARRDRSISKNKNNYEVFKHNEWNDWIYSNYTFNDFRSELIIKDDYYYTFREQYEKDIREEFLRLRGETDLEERNKEVSFEIACFHEDHKIGVSSIDKIRDESVLAKVAINARDHRVREKALGRIKDFEMLAYVARTSPFESVQQPAVNLINNEETLKELVLHATKSYVRLTAIQNINDHSFLLQVISDYQKQDDNIRWAAFEKLIENIDEKELLGLQNETSSLPAGMKTRAVSLINDENLLCSAIQSPLTELGANYTRDLIGKMCDKDVLKHLAKNGRMPWIISQAKTRLTDLNKMKS